VGGPEGREWGGRGGETHPCGPVRGYKKGGDKKVHLLQKGKRGLGGAWEYLGEGKWVKGSKHQGEKRNPLPLLAKGGGGQIIFYCRLAIGKRGIPERGTGGNTISRSKDPLPGLMRGK